MLIKGRTITNFIMDLSLSLTGAEYQYHERHAFETVPLTVRLHVIDLHIVSRATFVNIELGYKFKIAGGLFLQPSVLVCANRINSDRQRGTITNAEFSNYPNDPRAPANYYRANVYEVNTTHRYRNDRFAAARWTAFYRARIKGRAFDIIMFRNFGIRYKLPWRCAGVSVPL